MSHPFVGVSGPTGNPGVATKMIFRPTASSASRTASINAGCVPPITVSTPARRNTSRIAAILFRFATVSLIYVSLACVLWLKPRNQFVPTIILDNDTPPTIARGNSAIFSSVSQSSNAIEPP